MYEEVLRYRSEARDPMGFARLLANQANALAHLAVFDHAEDRYRQARTVFDRVGDCDAVDVIDRQLAEIKTYRDRRAGGDGPGSTGHDRSSQQAPSRRTASRGVP